MLSLGFAGGTPLRRVLAIGAHSDDLEIGCGGTILALTRANPGLAVDWVVLARAGDGRTRRAGAPRCSSRGAAASSVEVLGFRDGYLPHTAAEVKDAFEELKERVEPDLVLTHTRDDLHQDHRLVCELTWNTFRDHIVLEYEIPKWDGDSGRPNVYVPLEEDVVDEKLDLLGGHFGTQRGKDWYDVEVFRGLMRMRGMECAAPSGYAEAFVARKLSLAPDRRPVVRVLVTGSAGYVGSVLCPIFEQPGTRSSGSTRATTTAATSALRRPIADGCAVDVRDVEPADLEGFDAVVHLAALSNDPLGDLSPS